MRLKSTSLVSGFTLIELLVVIAVIGTLATLIVGNLGSSRIKAKDAAIVLETKQILSGVELETGATGDYTGICDLFDEAGNQLAKIKADIEGKGGIWESCTSDNNSYGITITLNAAQTNNPFAATAYAQFGGLEEINVPDPEPGDYAGVHSNEQVLLSDNDIRLLKEAARAADESFFEPLYYCTGAVPPYVEGGNFRSGYLYQLPTSGCGAKVSSFSYAQNSYSYVTGGLSGEGLDEGEVEVIGIGGGL